MSTTLEKKPKAGRGGSKQRPPCHWTQNRWSEAKGEQRRMTACGLDFGKAGPSDKNHGSCKAQGHPKCVVCMDLSQTFRNY